METKLIGFSFLLFMVLFSCKEDDSGPQYELDGTISVLLNGEVWSPQEVRANRLLVDCRENAIGLEFTYYNEAGFRRRNLSFTGLPPAVGHYLIHPGLSDNVCSEDSLYSLFSLPISDGDVVGDFYRPVEGEDNYVTVTSYDEQTKQLRGTFNLVVAYWPIPEYGRKVLDAPDTIRFTQGEFDVKID